MDALRYVDFAMSRVRMLLHFGVRPYIVFDGDYLPGKAGTEKDRASRREETRKAGMELLRMGRTTLAHAELQKSVDVTPEMARQFIEELKRAKIDYIVAPYEADSQLAYLEKRGIVSGILSEDSDLLVFGVKCLITKLDQYGDCIAIYRDDFTSCRDYSLVGWSDADFRCMAILSGCDYLPGIGKMGLVTAYRLLRKHKTVERLIRAVQFDGKMKVPADYLGSYKKAELTFLHQWVYCPEAKSLVNLNPSTDGLDLMTLDCIGRYVEPEVATKVAQGYLHPHSKQLLSLHVPLSTAARNATGTKVSHSTPDLKKHPSIDQFFKARRTPLAELDPNSFTPSPTQQQMLQRPQVAWAAAPVDARPAYARASTGVPHSSSRPDRHIDADIYSEGRLASPKRQRLCLDDITPGVGSVSSAKSKFLPNSSCADSPSLRQGTKIKQSKSASVNIWSDDSIEEALSQLPEPTEESHSISKTRRVKVFNDFKDISRVSSLSGMTDSQGSGMRDSQTTTMSESTRPSSVASSAVETAVTSFDIQEPPDGAATPAYEPIPDATVAIVTLGEEYASKLSPQAIKDAVRTPAVQEQDTVPCSSPPQDRSIEYDGNRSAEEEPISDADWSAADGQEVSLLGKYALPGSWASRRNKTTSDLHSLFKGSEDLLVPDSEGEEDTPKRPTFAFDIGKFAFAGAR